MPLHWRIDSKARLVSMMAEGLVSDRDFLRCVSAIRGAGASQYRKLFDCANLDLAMDEDQVLAAGGRIRAGYGDPMGPLAIVLPAEPPEALTRLLGILATADRPMRLFPTRLKAIHWLDRVSPVHAPGGERPATAEADQAPADAPC